jgi:hypothetical protein
MSATSTRNAAGRFTKATPHAACTQCGCLLAENLLGDLRCLLKRCDQAGLVVGNSGADVGVLAGVL